MQILRYLENLIHRYTDLTSNIIVQSYYNSALHELEINIFGVEFVDDFTENKFKNCRYTYESILYVLIYGLKVIKIK